MVLAAGDGETWAGVRARSWLQAYTLHACRCKSAQGRGVQQRGDARAAGGGEARALEIAGSRARAREAGAQAGERLVP